jgi:dipeptidyl aminopeptidase/acylaminoacyl peptidase
MNRSSSRTALALAAGTFLLSFVAGAQQENRIDEVLNELDQVKPLADVSISPDGNWVAWVEHAAGHGGTSVHLLKRSDAGAAARMLTIPDAKEPAHDRDISWAPDSSRFAFLSDAGSDQDQVYVVSTADAAPRKETDLSGYVTDVRWSHDGKLLAFLYAENGGGGGPLKAAPAQLGEMMAAKGVP